jgi:hypothetical protein
MQFFRAFPILVLLAAVGILRAATGDPQLKTDHPWYPGELSCSTFEHLFATQAELYKRVTGRSVESDEDKALASWYWRNLHYAHAEEGKGDCMNAGFAKSEWNRDYWNGLFAQGFGLCGTTHSQYTAEIEALLGHCRARCVGVSGHNSFEVYLTGGAYGAGKWALLDHDLSTVIFSSDGTRLLDIREIGADLKDFANPAYKPSRQRGWRVAGEHDSDAQVYDSYRVAEYLAGYAGAPPMVQLRPGESFRRYLHPGLDDGKTYVFWGMNYKAGSIPGPMRDRSWVNQPEKMFGSKNGTGWHQGQVRYGNAVYTYAPDFAGGSYKQGVVEETPQSVTFDFYTPYVIAATPPNDKAWGIYDAGGKNGLVLHGKGTYPIALSVDQGKTWQEAGAFSDGVDLTDRVKGRQQYWLKFGAPASELKAASLSWRTICQCNAATIPQLHDGSNKVIFLASGRGIISAGPHKDQAQAHVVEGKMGSNSVTLELSAPRNQKALHIYAASWQASGAPPAPVAYRIDFSLDGGKSWQPIVKDWKVIRREPEPPEFWSQSFCWGDIELKTPATGPVRVKFSNDGRKQYRKVEAHLAYEVAEPSPTEVTFAWKESGGELKTATHTYGSHAGPEDATWSVAAGSKVETVWVEYAVK